MMLSVNLDKLTASVSDHGIIYTMPSTEIKRLYDRKIPDTTKTLIIRNTLKRRISDLCISVA